MSDQNSQLKENEGTSRAEASALRTDPASAPPSETQGQRWLKYGSNVALTIIVVLAVGGFLIYFGQHWDYRKDTTEMRSHSLSDPTVELVKTLPSKVKLVSLYTKVKPPDESGKVDEQVAQRYQDVSDLLDEYARKGGDNIAIEKIDPLAGLKPGLYHSNTNLPGLTMPLPSADKPAPAPSRHQ